MLTGSGCSELTVYGNISTYDLNTAAYGVFTPRGLIHYLTLSPADAASNCQKWDHYSSSTAEEENTKQLKSYGNHRSEKGEEVPSG